MKVISLMIETRPGQVVDRVVQDSPAWIGGQDDCEVRVPGYYMRAARFDFSDDGVYLTVVQPDTEIELDDRVLQVGEKKPVSSHSRIRIPGFGRISLKHQTFRASLEDRFGPSSPVPQERDFKSSEPEAAHNVVQLPPTEILPAKSAKADLDKTMLDPVTPMERFERRGEVIEVKSSDNSGEASLTHLNVGMLLGGRYQLTGRIGAGGMGAVFEAKDTKFNEAPPVAVKVLNASFMGDDEAHARFKREADIASKLRQHENIVKVFDYGIDRGVPFIVMEMLRGQDLARRLLDKTISRENALEAILVVCAAVFAAHEKKVIHRDLKPQNVFISEGPTGMKVKILDFGISIGATLPTLTRPGMVVGTWEYMAPELTHGQPATAASDQYAIGVMLYQAVTGRLPFTSSNPATLFKSIAAGSFTKPRDLDRDLPADLESIILRAMAVHDSDRFANVQELGAALLGHVSTDAQRAWMRYFTMRNPNAVYSVPSRIPSSTSSSRDASGLKSSGAPIKSRRKADRREQKIVVIMFATTLAVALLMIAVKVWVGGK